MVTVTSPSIYHLKIWCQGLGDFGSSDFKTIVEHFNVPLQGAGFNGNIEDALEEWRELIDYAVTYLLVECTPYLEVLYRLFNSARKDQWKVAMLFMELLLCIPISNAVVEKLFSLMSRIKTKSRCSLSNKRMSKLIRLCLDGPPFNEFDATPFVEEWFTHSERRISQNRRKTYAQRKSDEPKRA